jgi:hypothetical protein
MVAVTVLVPVLAVAVVVQPIFVATSLLLRTKNLHQMLQR